MVPHEIINVIVSHIVEDAATFISTGLGALTVYLIHKVRDMYKEYRRKSHNSIPKLIESDLQVYQTLSELLYSTRCDRAFVLQFHNGTYYVNQANQMKSSCTHEVVREGISREQNNLKDLLLSRMAVTVSEIISHTTSEFIVHDGTMANPNYFFQLLRDQGVSVFIASPMMNDNAVEGIIGLVYLDRDDYDRVRTANNIPFNLTTAAQKIGFTLRDKS